MAVDPQKPSHLLCGEKSGLVNPSVFGAYLEIAGTNLPHLWIPNKIVGTIGL